MKPIRVRQVDRKERWKRLCRECKRNFVPKEYTTCDHCFLGQFSFTTTFDALDYLCQTPLIPEKEVLRALRIIKDGVSVDII